MFRPSNDPFPLWESPVPWRDQKRVGAGVGDDEALRPSQVGPIVGAGFLLSTRRCSLDGLCTEREIEGRAALGALKREDYAWTMTLTITSLLGSASCCLGVD